MVWKLSISAAKNRTSAQIKNTTSKENLIAKANGSGGRSQSHWCNSWNPDGTATSFAQQWQLLHIAGIRNPDPEVLEWWLRGLHASWEKWFKFYQLNKFWSSPPFVAKRDINLNETWEGSLPYAFTEDVQSSLAMQSWGKGFKFYQLNKFWSFQSFFAERDINPQKI